VHHTYITTTNTTCHTTAILYVERLQPLQAMAANDGSTQTTTRPLHAQRQAAALTNKLL